MKFLVKFQFAIFVMISLCGTTVWGEEESIRFSSLLKFSGGVASAFLIHEGAHALAAGITGTDMTWEFGNYNQPIAFTEHSDSDTKGLS